MAEFVYTAKNRAGKTVSGSIVASSQKNAKNILVNKGLKPINVRVVASKSYNKTGGIIVRDEK
jgi:type II secretory pathway component PulF